MKEITVGKNEAGQRLDKLLGKILNQAPSGFIYKMLRKKNIKLNQKKAEGSDLLQEGDIIQIYLSDDTFDKFHEEKTVGCTLRELKTDSIIYEDSDIIIINKPAGVLSQKAKPEDDSINEMMIRYLQKKGDMTEAQMQTFLPSVCNRLDRNTSGIILAGKSLFGSQELSRMLRERSLDKYYLALAYGCIKEPKKVQAYIDKDAETNRVQVNAHSGSDRIEMEYKPLCTSGDYTLLEVKLITGKTHQIRAHLSYLGHPIIGDSKYGDSKENRVFRDKYKIQNQCLHAWRVKFPKGDSQQKTTLSSAGRCFTAPLPHKVNEAYKDIFHVELSKIV